MGRANQAGIRVVMVALILAACGSNTTAVEPTTQTTVAAAIATTIDPTVSPDPEIDAVARIEAFFVALNEGRVDDMAEIFGQELSEADRLLWEFNAALERVYPREVGQCEVSQSIGSIIMVECPVTFTDPVTSATGVSEVIYPYRYHDGVITWSQMRLAEGTGSPFAGSKANADYLELFHPDDATACSFAADTGSAHFNGYLVLVPACADVLIAHASDVAAWVKAGRPEGWNG